jgi:uncharacterized caspase-like protein
MFNRKRDRLRDGLVLLLIAVFFSFSTTTEALAAKSPNKSRTIESSDRPPGLPTTKLAVADKWALVIGISKFKDPSIQLKYAAKDALDFYDFLINQAHFANDHVKLLVDEDATRENILNQLGDKWLPHVAMPEDLVVIYISSHGSPSSADVGGLNYLVAHNTDKNNLFVSGIPMQDLTRLIKERVHAQRIVVILDACHSGAVRADNKGLFRQGNFDADEFAKNSGQLVICSSQPNQSSWESLKHPNGVFTYQLIAALKQKNASTPLGEAFKTMAERVSQEVLSDRGELQRPILKSAWEGSDLTLGVVPTQPRKVPDELSATENIVKEKISISQEPPAEPTTTKVDSITKVATATTGAKPQARETTAQEKSEAALLDKIAPIWKVTERGFGTRYTSKWTFDRAKEEFDDVVDNGTQATIKIVEYDGKRIILTRTNYAGKHIGNMYRYEGTCDEHGARGRVSLSNSILSPMSWKWEATW